VHLAVVGNAGFIWARTLLKVVLVCIAYPVVTDIQLQEFWRGKGPLGELQGVKAEPAPIGDLMWVIEEPLPRDFRGEVGKAPAHSRPIGLKVLCYPTVLVNKRREFWTWSRHCQP